MSYFAKPHFIVYDEWFDNDFKKTNHDDKNKKITNIPNIHEYFYKKSNYKVGASENNLPLDIKVNIDELSNNYYCKNNSDKYTSLSNKKLLSFDKFTKNKLKFNITKKLIFSISIFSFIFIVVLLLYFSSESKKNESNISNRFFNIEKES